MLINRLTGWSSEEPPVRFDYWVIRTRTDSFLVSEAEAERVMGLVRRRFAPRWIGFRDLCGARIRVLSEHVVLVGESTTEQRAYDRRFREALDRESGDEETWPE